MTGRSKRILVGGRAAGTCAHPARMWGSHRGALDADGRLIK